VSAPRPGADHSATLAGPALAAAFTHYARLAGAEVHPVPAPQAAGAVIASLGPGPVRCSSAVARRWPDLCAALDAADAGAVPDGDAADRTALDARLAGGSGVLLAEMGVAETGSVLLADDALADRLLGMLADVMVVLLPASALAADLDAAGRRLRDLDAAGVRYASLVTGPSRTADIERVLTIGVQGPRALHIILLDEA